MMTGLKCFNLAVVQLLLPHSDKSSLHVFRAQFSTPHAQPTSTPLLLLQLNEGLLGILPAAVCYKSYK